MIVLVREVSSLQHPAPLEVSSTGSSSKCVEEFEVEHKPFGSIWHSGLPWSPMVSHGLPWSPMVSLVSGMIRLVATKIGSKSSCEPASKHSEPGCSCELCVIFSFPTQLIQPSSTIHMMWHRIVGVVWAFWCLRFSVKNLLPSRLNADVCARYDFDNEQIGQGLVPVWRSKMVSQNFQRDHMWCSADYASCLLNLCPSFPCDSIAIPEDYRIHRVILPRILQPKMHQNAGKLDTWNAKKHQQMICAIEMSIDFHFFIFFSGGCQEYPGITQLTQLPGAFGSVFVARDKRQQERKVLICADVGWGISRGCCHPKKDRKLIIFYYFTGNVLFL